MKAIGSLPWYERSVLQRWSWGSMTRAFFTSKLINYCIILEFSVHCLDGEEEEEMVNCFCWFFSNIGLTIFFPNNASDWRVLGTHRRHP